MHLLQLRTRDGGRAVAVVDGAQLWLLDGVVSVRELAARSFAAGRSLEEMAASCAGRVREDYDQVIAERRLLPPLDHEDPAHLLVSGTGLTHLGSAAARDRMHRAADSEITDSIRMFRMGLEGGKPADGAVGVQPEWFYKGDGSWIVPPEGDLVSPAFALDAGEEPEVCGLYWIAPDGTPCRLGFALGNEFSDHVTERHNYLWLAHSKLRVSSFGPELVTGELPASIEGESRIRRGDRIVWRQPFWSGEANMSHSIANLEHHHFKYAAFRRPGDLHLHFFGTATLSFADGVHTEPGDVFEIEAPFFGRPLRNRLVVEERDEPVRVGPL